MKKLSRFFNVKSNIASWFIVSLIIIVSMNNLIIGQTATTFTASDIMVTNTITAGGSIKGH